MTPDELRELVEGATPGCWKAAYWPIPKPHYWIGTLSENIVSSKLDQQITGPIPNEADAKLIEKAPMLATLLADMAEALGEIAKERFGVMPDGSTPCDYAARVLARLSEVKT